MADKPYGLAGVELATITQPVAIEDGMKPVRWRNDGHRKWSERKNC